jgi:polysaccharide deacetylase 2 family uncharacterized protein YibQ
VGLIVTGVGLAREPSEAALRLPAGVALAVSPYADDASTWLDRARAGGHAALLVLPLEMADPQHRDPGPRALGVRQADTERQAALDWLLERGKGYAGVAGEAGAFAAAPGAFAPVARALAARGLAFVELGGDALADVARANGLAYLATGPALDEMPAADRIDQALAALAARAREQGSARGWAGLRPVTCARITAWVETAPAQRARLVGLPALLHRDAPAPQAAARP